MNNIKSFTDFINENKYHKIIIDGETGKMTGDGKKIGTATSKIFNAIENAEIISYMDNLTGGYNGNGLENTIKLPDNLKSINRTHNKSHYPEKDVTDCLFIKFPEKFIKNLRTVFKIKPGNKTIGSGEILFANYYDNVRRNKYNEGESGDCTYNENGHIEIKAADAPFRTLDNYLNIFKRLRGSLGEKTDDSIDEMIYQYAGGIAAYMFRQKYPVLDLIIFDGEIGLPDTMTGYLTIKKDKNDTINSIINKIKDMIVISDTTDKKGGTGSRDFTISYEGGKIMIHPKIKSEV